MDLKQMQYFLAVAEQLNFSKAADVLYVTQPLLSQRVAELEKELGVTLFNRTRRSVQLTPAGAVLADKARSVLDEVNAISTLVQRTAAGIGLECDLNIGFEEVFERTLLTQTLFYFHANYPSYHGHLCSYTLGQIMKALHEEEIELAFTLLPNRKIPPDVETQEIARDSLDLVAASPLVVKDPTLEQVLPLFETLPLFLMNNDQRGLASVLELCTALQITPQPKFYSDVPTILMNVEAGGGVTILPHRIVSTYASPYLVSCSLPNQKEAQLILAACWNRKTTNPAIPVFLNCLAATIAGSDRPG